MNKLLEMAATRWVKTMEEKNNFSTGIFEKDTLIELFTKELIHKDDSSIEKIEEFIINCVDDGDLYYIYLKEQYLYCSNWVDEPNIKYKEIRGINLKTLCTFEGKSKAIPKGNAAFWSAVYPHLATTLSLISDDEDEFIKEGGTLRLDTWSDHGSPAWYYIDIHTGEYQYDYIAD
jgi:hypothetical protein